MSRNRLENLDPERQHALFEAAAAEFAAHGIDGASLNRILEKSGIGKSSYYYYFEDKADLFTTVLERSLAVIFRQIGGLDPAALTAEHFWQAIEERYGKAIAIVNANDWLVRFGHLFYTLRARPKSSAATNRLFDLARRWVRDLVLKGQELGVVRSDLPESLLIDLAMGLLEVLDRWVVAHWEGMTVDERAELPSEHIRLFRDLLAPVPAENTSPTGE